MDNITHTLAGFALSASGLSRKSRLATAALVLGSNLPDVDIVTLVGGRLTFIDQHRGISHSLVGGCVLGALLGISLWAFGRRMLRERPERGEVRFAPLVLLSLLAVGLHLGFDCLNDYGIRLLLPFVDRWAYGDIIFIVDPWFWLLLGGGIHLSMPAGRAVEMPAWTGWAALSLPVLLDSSPPMPAKVLWLLGLGVLGVLRLATHASPEPEARDVNAPAPAGRTPSPSPATTGTRPTRRPLRWRSGRAAVWPRTAFALLAVYVVSVSGLHARALAGAREAVRRREAQDVSHLAVIPRPADPFHWNVIYETPPEVVAGLVKALPSETDGIARERRFRKNLDDPRAREALTTRRGRTAARFCRYLFADIVDEPDGAADVSFRDARFTIRDRHEFSVFTVRVGG